MALRKQPPLAPSLANSDELSETRLLELFAMFDKDGGGSIDVDELTEALDRLGLKEAQEEVVKLLDKIDTDRSGVIELAEFRQMMHDIVAQRDTPGEMYRAFLVFSGGRDRITIADLRNAMAEVEDERTDQYLSEMLALADTDKDGVVNFHDFRAMMELACRNEREGLNDPRKVLEAADANDGFKL